MTTRVKFHVIMWDHVSFDSNNPNGPCYWSKIKVKVKKVNKSNLNSNSNYKSPFCPFCLFQNPFGIWGCDKKQSWSLFYKDQLWYSKFLKFTYKIWSNFEMIQMHPKFKFQNGGRIWKCSFKQSCRTWNFEQLLFLEIFNFCRNIESNL